MILINKPKRLKPQVIALHVLLGVSLITGPLHLIAIAKDSPKNQSRLDGAMYRVRDLGKGQVQELTFSKKLNSELDSATQQQFLNVAKLSDGTRNTNSVSSFPLIAQNLFIPKNICQSWFRVVRTPDGKNLAVRSPGSRDNRIIGSLRHGTEVLAESSDRTGQWTVITAPGGLSGVVPTRFLAPNPADNSKFNGTMRVKTLDGSSVNVRDGAARTRVLDNLPTGTIVQYHGFEGYWSVITTPKGIRGYIASQYLVCN